jgi:transcription elongation GreA/GreB family factor
VVINSKRLSIDETCLPIKNNNTYLDSMTSQQQIAYKMQLKEKCRTHIKERMDALRMAMDVAQDAANEETKSSAGDKYETARAMGQLEKEMYARQLAETSKEMVSLMEIDCSNIYKNIVPGSLVRCEYISYFILAGIGKIRLEEELIYAISPNAPIAKLLTGKKKGDTVTINNKSDQIIEIF